MSDAAEVRALIAEAREVASWMTPSDGHIAEVLNRCADALEAAHAEPDDDDEREALWEVADEYLEKNNIEDLNPPSLSETFADMVWAAGFRRSARVPVSLDELRRIVLEQLERKDSIARVARSTVIVDALTATHDIYPKADRKPDESQTGDDR